MAAKHGRTGRMPKEFVTRAQFLAEKAKVLEFYAKTVQATGEATPDRLSAGEKLLNRAYGTPPQSVDVTSGGEKLQQTILIGGVKVEFT